MVCTYSITCDARGRIRFTGAALARGAHHTGDVLSKEQIRYCLQSQKSLNFDGEKIDASELRIKINEAEIKELETEILFGELKVDKTSQESVDGFNVLIVKHKNLIASYNKNIPIHNAIVQRYEAKHKNYTRNCVGRSYYESDMQEVLAGK